MTVNVTRVEMRSFQTKIEENLVERKSERMRREKEIILLCGAILYIFKMATSCIYSNSPLVYAMFGSVFNVVVT